jgi:hypothetical protein
MVNRPEDSVPAQMNEQSEILQPCYAKTHGLAIDPLRLEPRAVLRKSLSIEGTVCISASELMAAHILPPIIGRMRQEPSRRTARSPPPLTGSALGHMNTFASLEGGSGLIASSKSSKC